MTQEVLNKANANRSEFEWCKKMRDNYLHRMKFRFNWSTSCIDNSVDLRFPEWLKDMIFEEVEKRQEELEKEFAEL